MNKSKLKPHIKQLYDTLEQEYHILQGRRAEQAAELEALRDDHEHLIAAMTDIAGALKLREAEPDAQMTTAYIVKAAQAKQAEIERLRAALDSARDYICGLLMTDDMPPRKEILQSITRALGNEGGA